MIYLDDKLCSVALLLQLKILKKKQKKASISKEYKLQSSHGVVVLDTSLLLRSLSLLHLHQIAIFL